MEIVSNTHIGDAKPVASPGSAGKKPYFPILQWLARHFGRPSPKSAIERGLPADYASQGKGVLPRLLSVIGLKSKFAKRQISNLDPIVLPCVVFEQNETPAILTEISLAEKTVSLVEFKAEVSRKKITFAEFEARYQPEVLLVTNEVDATQSMSGSVQDKQQATSSDWIWKPIREHAGAWGQIFLAALAINILGLALPIFVMNVYDRVIPNLAIVTLWTLVGGVTIALFLDLLMKMIRTSVLEHAGRRIDMKIAASLFQQAMNIKLLERKGGSAGIANQIRDFESVRDFFTSSSFTAIIDLLFIGIFVAVLWLIVGPIAVVPLLAVPVVVVIGLIAQAPIAASVEKSLLLSAKRSHVLIESLQGIETIKSLNGERTMQREWEEAVAATSRINGKTRFWSNFAANSTMFIQQAVSVLIILWGVYLVADGRITIGGLIAANILAGRVLAPLANISQTLVRAQQALKSFRSISQFMQYPTEAPDRVESEFQVHDGNIAVRNATFSYPEAKVPALSNLDFAYESGQTVGIVGRVGSGKTTLCKLLSGFIQQDEGTVLVDGREISQYDPSVLRDGIGYLPQDPEMFTGTIRENLLIGKPDASEEDLKFALHYSGMDYFVSENPEGINQFVGDRGNRLSGGQKQAISIARLLLRRPKLLLLDEPTNAMDHTTEAVLISRLKELSQMGTGLIILTHRHSLVAIVERLVVLDNGRKVLEGPRDAVLKKLSGGSGPVG